MTRFQAAASDLLLRLDVPPDLVDEEHREMREVRIGKTASRQVLGSMNDFAYLMGAYRERTISFGDVAVKLAAAPCSPIGMKRSADVALEMLAGRA